MSLNYRRESGVFKKFEGVDYETLWRLRETHDAEVKEYLINKYRSFVFYCVKNFCYRYPFMNNFFEDLVQEGMMALCKAIDNYDVSKNCFFKKYALLWIRAYLNIFYANNIQIVFIPRNLRFQLQKYKKFFLDGSMESPVSDSTMHYFLKGDIYEEDKEDFFSSSLFTTQHSSFEELFQGNDILKKFLSRAEFLIKKGIKIIPIGFLIFFILECHWIMMAVLL